MSTLTKEKIEGMRGRGLSWQEQDALIEAALRSFASEIRDIAYTTHAMHSDHPLRHWDHTCPGCIEEERLRRVAESAGIVQVLPLAAQPETITSTTHVLVPVATLEKWGEAIEPYQFDGSYNNNGVINTLAEIATYVTKGHGHGTAKR